MNLQGGTTSFGFIPLMKIDVERRLVIGRAAQEVPDRTKEIMDYASAKPAFEKWSQGFVDATGGLSKGNVRVMHGTSVAGKIVDLQFDDATKSVDVVAHIVDNNEWEKCLKGVYTGFSMGGGYARKWADGDLTRYTPDVRELSLVDLPCIPTARFAELVKADGMVEQLPLIGRPQAALTFAEIAAQVPLTFAEMQKRARREEMEAEIARPKTFAEMQKGVGAVVGKLTRKGGTLRRSLKQGAVAGGAAALAGAGGYAAATKVAPPSFGELMAKGAPRAAAGGLYGGDVISKKRAAKLSAAAKARWAKDGHATNVGGSSGAGNRGHYTQGSRVTRG